MDLAKIPELSAEGTAAEPFPMLVRCYTEVGKITGLGEITVEAQQMVSSISSPTHMVRVTVETSGDYPTSGVATINYDDVDRVCTTLDRLRAADPGATKFNYMEVISEFGELKIVVFNTSDRRMFFSAQVQSAGVHMELSRLTQLIDLLKRAKVLIDQNRTTAMAT